MQVSRVAMPDPDKLSLKQTAVKGLVESKDLPLGWKFVSYANSFAATTFENNPDGDIHLEPFLERTRSQLTGRIVYTYIYSDRDA